MADVFVVKWNNLKIYVTFPRGMAKRVDNNCTLPLSLLSVSGERRMFVCHARHDGVTLVCTQTIFSLFFLGLHFWCPALAESPFCKRELGMDLPEAGEEFSRNLVSDYIWLV